MANSILIRKYCAFIVVWRWLNRERDGDQWMRERVAHEGSIIFDAKRIPSNKQQ